MTCQSWCHQELNMFSVYSRLKHSAGKISERDKILLIIYQKPWGSMNRYDMFRNTHLYVSSVDINKDVHCLLHEIRIIFLWSYIPNNLLYSNVSVGSVCLSVPFHSPGGDRSSWRDGRDWTGPSVCPQQQNQSQDVPPRWHSALVECSYIDILCIDFLRLRYIKQNTSISFEAFLKW
jgi:hypothetical protein